MTWLLHHPWTSVVLPVVALLVVAIVYVGRR